MTEKTKIATEKIADYLKLIMKEKGISAQDIINDGKNPQQVYSVLRIGNTPRPNYSIETFLDVISIIGIHLEFHDLQKKSNFDLINPNSKN
jgi:hypothetical protein